MSVCACLCLCRRLRSPSGYLRRCTSGVIASPETSTRAPTRCCTTVPWAPWHDACPSTRRRSSYVHACQYHHQDQCVGLTRYVAIACARLWCVWLRRRLSTHCHRTFALVPTRWWRSSWLHGQASVVRHRRTALLHPPQSHQAPRTSYHSCRARLTCVLVLLRVRVGGFAGPHDCAVPTAAQAWCRHEPHAVAGANHGPAVPRRRLAEAQRHQRPTPHRACLWCVVAVWLCLAVAVAACGCGCACASLR